MIKNNLLTIPKVFELIQNNSGSSQEEMYQVFNMGHRIQIFTEEKHAKAMIELIQSFNIEAKVIGFTDAYSGKKVTIQSAGHTFSYTA